MEFKKTERKFDYASFTDAYGKECSIQKSSSAMIDRIWFGITKPEPIIMASDVNKIRLKLPEDNDGTGWVPFPFPDEVLISTRMHLDQEQVKQLIPILQRFVETGEVENPDAITD